MAFFTVAFACVACTAPSQPLTSVAIRDCEEAGGGGGGASFQKMPVERPGSSGERGAVITAAEWCVLRSGAATPRMYKVSQLTAKVVGKGKRNHRSETRRSGASQLSALMAKCLYVKGWTMIKVKELPACQRVGGGGGRASGQGQCASGFSGYKSLLRACALGDALGGGQCR